MRQPWESDDCAGIKAQYAVYSIPQAAALWCGVPERQVAEIVLEAKQVCTTGPGRSIWAHPTVPCLEPRTRAIAEAIESGELPCGREDGETVPDHKHVAHERRHIRGRDLRRWLERAFPNDKPTFLFDDIERSAHTAISADAYRALKAEHDKLATRLAHAGTEYRKLRQEKESIEAERNSLKAAADKLGTPGERAESTYQNTIAALLACIAGDLPGIEKHPSFTSEAKLIDAIDQHFRGYSGLSKSNLSRKLPEAKRALQSQ